MPYSDSEEEREEGGDLAVQVVVGNEELPSPPPKEKDEPIEKASSSMPRTQKINQLLRQVYEMGILEREIKKNNAILTKRNKQLHNYFLEMRGRYILLKRRNLRYMKDNTKLYKMIRLHRLQMKDAKPNHNTHLILETLAEAAISLQHLESNQAIANLPNMEPTE